MKNYHVLRADPAGNITMFVLDDTLPRERPAIAKAIMKNPLWGVQQVAFALPAPPGLDGAFTMMGGEFCGNATRAYGMWLARQRGQQGKLLLQVSGCDHPVEVWAEDDTASAQMPLPQLVRQETAAGVPCTLVHLGGIAHLVVEDIPPEESFFAEAEPCFSAFPELEAYGVIFLQGKHVTPLVKVVPTDTLVWEGSCGSGSLAAAIAQSAAAGDGAFSAVYQQPAGNIAVQLTRQGERVVSARIGGMIALSEITEIQL